MAKTDMVQMNLYCGMENSIVIDDLAKSVNENGFMSESYIQILRILGSYLRQTDQIRKELESNDYPEAITEFNNILYRSPQNVIAFSGKRGTGKTSTILSVAETLKNHKKCEKTVELILSDPEYQNLEDDFEDIKNRYFITLNPIDPTMLESKQNILNAVLSRIMFKAQGLWNDAQMQSGAYRNFEEEKNRILNISRDCLDEIQSLKFVDKIEDLDNLQKYGDSAILKRNLFKLIENVGKLCRRNAAYAEKRDMLVILIDDTDCQISQGYAVMEDIRRYLTLPNVLILMATDMDMLRQVIIKNFAEQFSGNLKYGTVSVSTLENSAEKYMAKMIPPTFKVYLPLADDLIRDHGQKINIHYFANSEMEQDNSQKDLLGEKYGFQSKILSYVNTKTGLFFAEHRTYCNSLIPQTLRGLAQLLGFLYTMDDVHESHNSKKLSKNLKIFENYFLHEWAPSKLDDRMCSIINEIALQTPQNRIKCAEDELAEYYEIPYDANKPSDESYFTLDQTMREILGTADHQNQFNQIHVRMKDYRNMFAVRTIIGILNAGDMAREMSEEGDTKSINGNSFPDVFYFSADDLPTFQWADPDRQKSAGAISSCEISEKLLSGIFEIFNGNQDKELSPEICYQQKMLADIIMCNWGAQDLLREAIKEVDNELKSKRTTSLRSQVRLMYCRIVEKLGSANNGMLKNMSEIILSTDNKNVMGWQTAWRKLDQYISKENRAYIESVRAALKNVLQRLPEKLNDGYISSKLGENILKEISTRFEVLTKHSKDSTEKDLASRWEKLTESIKNNQDIEMIDTEYALLYPDLMKYSK